MAETADLVIAGGGVSGLALALAVHQASAGALSITLCDPSLASARPRDARGLALVAGSVRFLDGLGAWQAMAAEAQPVLAMDITDSGLSEPIRPLLLEFGGDDAFAHVIPAQTIAEALAHRVRQCGIRLRSAPVRVESRGPMRVALDVGGESLQTSLLIAADGRSSPLRQAAGISFYGWDYGQTGIVATVSHSLPHQGRAVEHFLPSGPFALLPMPGQACSVVWSEKTAAAERFLAMPPEDLCAQIERRSAGCIGTITDVRDVAGFPLSLGLARTFVAERLALLGDAAHVMHPIAGQGLNYGLRGAAALAEAILDAARLGQDIGSGTVLETYERARRSDVIAMAVATDGLNRLFSNDIGPVRLVRDIGLGLVQRLPRMKDWFVSEAAGRGGLAPRAFRGLPI